MSRQLSILAVILVIAVASLGVAYGAWSQTMTISGTVHTGTLAVEFQSFTLPDPADAYVVINTGTGVSTVAAPNDKLTINLGNLYPGYTGVFTFKVKNTGSIPVLVPAIAAQSSNTNVANVAGGCDGGTLAAGAEQACAITISVPETAGMNQPATISASVTAAQATN